MSEWDDPRRRAEEGLDGPAPGAMPGQAATVKALAREMSEVFHVEHPAIDIAWGELGAETRRRFVAVARFVSARLRQAEARQEELTAQLSLDMDEIASLRAERDDWQEAADGWEGNFHAARKDADRYKADRDAAREELAHIRKLAAKAKPVTWWTGTCSDVAWTLDAAAVAAIAHAALAGDGA